MDQQWDELLRQDHETAERVFAAIETNLASASAPPRAQIAGLVAFLRDYVDGCHNQKEERVLFPRLQACGMPLEAGPIAVMLDEHERGRVLLADLVSAGTAYAAGDDTALPGFREAFEAYAALCKDHFWKEGDILYPMATRILSAAEGEDIVRGIEALEDSLGAGTRAPSTAAAR